MTSRRMEQAQQQPPPPPPTSLDRRLIGSFPGTFEGWPPRADQRYLAIRARRATDYSQDPNYFSCDDLIEDTPEQRVHVGIERAAAAWGRWEDKWGKDPSSSEGGGTLLPPTFLEENVRGAPSSGGGRGRTEAGAGCVEESKEAGGGGGRGPSQDEEEDEDEDDEEAAPSYPEGEDLEEIVSCVPNYYTVQRDMHARLTQLGQSLKTIQWKGRLEEGGMKDTRKVPHLRKSSTNVVAMGPAQHHDGGGDGDESFTGGEDDEDDEEEEGRRTSQRQRERRKRRMAAEDEEGRQQDKALQARASATTGGEAKHLELWTDVIVTVTLLGRKNHSHTKLQEVELLGRHTLRDLRDNIHCTKAQVFQTDPALRQHHRAPTSCYFFIEGRFYLEPKDDPDLLSYVTNLNKWINKDPRRRHHLGLEDGEDDAAGGGGGGGDDGDVVSVVPSGLDTPLQDLQVRLGTRYLFFHIGECEHHVTFSDLRLPTVLDLSRRGHEVYPQHTFKKHHTKKRCMACDARSGLHMVVGDPLGHEYRMIYCGQCFHKTMGIREGAGGQGQEEEEEELLGTGTVVRRGKGDVMMMEVYTYLHED